jgi:hypothetical protein
MIEARTETASVSMSRAFTEYFKCPTEFPCFRGPKTLSSPAGFFRFGSELVCYGRLESGRVADSVNRSLEDSLATVRLDESIYCLPFDIDEVVSNLRLERYYSALHLKKRSVAGSFVRSDYYAVRPLLPVSVRKHFQRAALRGWDQTPFPRWPVDHTVDSIFETLMLLILRAGGTKRIPFIWFWPEGHRAAATMTHDVEAAAGRDFCSSLMDLNDSFGIKSSFQVVPEERYAVPREFLDTVRHRGFEVNVHDLNHDGNLFRGRSEFLRRAAKINQYAEEFGAVGYRSGVLYRNLEWYDAFKFSYDMSVPNVGHLDPQPGGCCTTKPYFIGNILEIPVTVVQDYTLFNILQQYSTDLWKKQVQLIMGRHGMANFIVHPDYVIEPRARGVYADLLAHLARLRQAADLWIALPREVNEWWRMRNGMSLVHRGGRWMIEGPGKERARVAFAVESQEKLIYEIPN